MVVTLGAGGAFAPEKYGLSGCIPAEMKSVDGSSGGGIRGKDGKRRCSFDSKNERKPSRSSAVVRTRRSYRGGFRVYAVVIADARSTSSTAAAQPSMPPTSPRGTPVSLMSRYRRKRHSGVAASCRLRDDSSRGCASDQGSSSGGTGAGSGLGVGSGLGQGSGFGEGGGGGVGVGRPLACGGGPAPRRSCVRPSSRRRAASLASPIASDMLRLFRNEANP